MRTKFKIGEKVHCYRKVNNAHIMDFNFVGVVISVIDTGDEIEYAVTNSPKIPITGFPILMWEHEMSGVLGGFSCLHVPFKKGDM